MHSLVPSGQPHRCLDVFEQTWLCVWEQALPTLNMAMGSPWSRGLQRTPDWQPSLLLSLVKAFPKGNWTSIGQDFCSACGEFIFIDTIPEKCSHGTVFSGHPH